MVSCSAICDIVVATFFTFKTPRLVRVRSFKIGLTFRLVQFLVLAYVIGFAIIYKKGYQETDKPESSVTIKLKGIASTIDRTDLRRIYRRVWDPADYVVPPQENGAFFVMTNAVITPRQQYGQCAEDPDVSPCDRLTERNEPHAMCPAGSIHPVGNGVMTGRCVEVPGKSVNACEISAWCRVEDDRVEGTGPLLPQAANFTVFIKNNIEFTKFQVKRSNILESATKKYLRRCRYDRHKDPTCPIFTLGYLTEAANTKFEDIALSGGVINIGIEWDCNLDYSVKKCVPVYKFNRLDHDSSIASVGWNFRYANYYRMPGGDQQRDLIKAYGILFIFTVSGKAGKFSIVPLILNIGAGVALLSVATLACDFILLYVVRNRDQYQENKFLEVMDEDFMKLGGQHQHQMATNGSTPAVLETSWTSALFNYQPEDDAVKTPKSASERTITLDGHRPAGVTNKT